METEGEIVIRNYVHERWIDIILSHKWSLFAQWNSLNTRTGSGVKSLNIYPLPFSLM